MNYRGVAKLSTMPKLLDAMTNDRIALHIQETIDKQQYDFNEGQINGDKFARVQLECEGFYGI